MKENWAMRIHWRYSCDTPAVRCCWSMEMTLAMTIHKTFLHDCVQQCDCDGCHGCYWSKSGTCQNRDNLWDKDDQLAKEKASTQVERDACQDNAQIEEYVLALSIHSALVIHKTFLHDCVHQCHCDSCHGCNWSMKMALDMIMNTEMQTRYEMILFSKLGLLRSKGLTLSQNPSQSCICILGSK